MTLTAIGTRFQDLQIAARKADLLGLAVADMIQLLLPSWVGDLCPPELLDLAGGWMSRMEERVVEDTGA